MDERQTLAMRAAAELSAAMEDLRDAGVVERPRPLTDGRRADLEHARGVLRDMVAALDAALVWVGPGSTLGRELKRMPAAEAERITSLLTRAGLL